MKRKIGEIYNKPIVEGDKNLVTKNEVHKSELSGGEGQENSMGDDILWYANLYLGYPTVNLTKETVLSGNPDSELEFSQIFRSDVLGTPANWNYILTNLKIHDYNFEKLEFVHAKSNIKVECEMSNSEKEIFNLGKSFISKDGSALNAPSPFVTDNGFGVSVDEILKVTSVITNTKKFDIIFDE